ncbi:TerC family protein [Neobacillus drentensis]|uniref:TerC family protein n=1 Tax=Neobacillus drentensis TaxID=220684 RepID=UPI003001C498
MTDFLKVFLITLVSDIDNMLILGTILHRYTYLNLTIPAIMVLTLTRTIYVVIVNRITDFPMFHLLMGIVLLIIAFKLVRTSINGEPVRKPARGSYYLKAKVLLLIAATDLLICMDSIMIISGITQQFKDIILGIFCSLLISIVFLPLIVNLASTFFWINIIAGAFIAQNSVIGILNDPLLAGPVQAINKLFPETELIQIAANGTIIIFIIIGVVSYRKQQRITIHK